MHPSLTVMLENHDNTYILARGDKSNRHLMINHVTAGERKQGCVDGRANIEGAPGIIGIGPHPSAENCLPDDNFSKAVAFGIVQRVTIAEESGNKMNRSIRSAYENAVKLGADIFKRAMTPVEELERVRFSSLLSVLSSPFPLHYYS
jgi:hypothetical protein